VEGFMRGVYSVSEWVMRFAYVNILWITFSIMGLLVLGFFPATTAMFTVIRKWVLKQPDIPTFKIFTSVYKKEFLKSNVVGMIIVFFGVLMYFNIRIIDAMTNPLLKLLYIPVLLISLLFLLTLMFVFPVYTHYEINVVKVFKNSFLLMAVSPIITFSMAVLTTFFLFILLKLPGLFPFFSGSFSAFILMWLSNHVFGKFPNLKC
jgi:uncharacterized membrane protein YesL